MVSVVNIENFPFRAEFSVFCFSLYEFELQIETNTEWNAVMKAITLLSAVVYVNPYGLILFLSNA